MYEEGKDIALNAEFQTVARREKKSFFNEQCKVEENNRMGETRDHFKKIGDIKGIFHARMGTIKDRVVRTYQRQKRLRRGGKNTEELY